MTRRIPLPPTPPDRTSTTLDGLPPEQAYRLGALTAELLAAARAEGWAAAARALRNGQQGPFWEWLTTHPLADDPSSMAAIAADYLEALAAAALGAQTTGGTEHG